MSSEGDLLDSIRNFASLDPQECSQRQLMNEANIIIKRAKVDNKQASKRGKSLRSAKGRRKPLKETTSPAPQPSYQVRETSNIPWQPAVAQQKRSLALMSTHLQHQLSATSTAGLNHISGELSPVNGPINKDLIDVTRKKSAGKNRSKE